MLIYLASKSGFIDILIVDAMGHEDNWFIQIIFNLAYLQFFRHFLDLQTNNPKLDRLLKTYFGVSLSLSTLVFLVLFGLQQLHLFFYFFTFIFLSSILVLSVYSLYKAMQLNYSLKYYVIVGASCYISFAMYSFYLSLMGLYFFETAAITPFYIGILIESFVFSMGLGHKVKKLSDERIMAKQLLIEQLRENEIIKEADNKKLQKEVVMKTDVLMSILKEREEEKLEKISLQYEQKLLELKFVSLRNQMNPHFIFNALNAIKSSIINNDKIHAIMYLNKFSQLLREILKGSDKLIYSLYEELEALKLYLKIENIRLKNKVECIYNIQEGIDLLEYKIPPLLLQPLVENAIWHGLSLVESHPKKIIISIFHHLEKSNFVTIIIEDNGIGLEKAEELKRKKIHQRDSLGIRLVKDRLALFSQKLNAKCDINILDMKHASPAKQGTQAVIQLPFG